MNISYSDFRINKPMAISGSLMLILALILIAYLPFNDKIVLGINSVIKPIKFALSIWIYSWTFALLLPFWENQKAARNFSILAIITMYFEQTVIVFQALRGKLSHFNQNEISGGILYALMGIMIVWLTLATLFLTVRFIRQKPTTINKTQRESIIYGLILFIIFSFWGGLMSVYNTHTIGGEMGGEGLKFTNWSTKFGDLRVAHFFGIHALQIIPLIGISLKSISFELSKKLLLLRIVSLVYFLFLVYISIKSLNGHSFFE